MIEILASHLRVQMAVILALYIFVILRFSERNRAQMALLYNFVIWFIVFAIKGVILSISPKYIVEVQSLSFQTLFMGLICFLAILIYPIIILNPKLIFTKMSAYLLSPVLVSMLVYVGYQLYIGQPFFVDNSLNEVIAQWGSTSMTLLFIIAIVFLLYIIAMLCSIWFLVPSFQKYIQNNFADNTYNVDWLRNYVIFSSIIGVFYLIVLFYGTVFTMLLYMLNLIISFGAVLDYAVRHKTFDLPEGYSVDWHYKKGWCWLYQGVPVEDITETDSLTGDILTNKFFSWMEEDKPYCNSNFSTVKIKSHIPNFNFELLNVILQEKGFNFQSYIRKCRIDEAIRILSDKDNHLSYKEVSYEVGFSQYPSFCRAFIAVTGQSPSKFCEEKNINFNG